VKNRDNFSSVYEIANQLLTRHSPYFVPWMNDNELSFWNVNEVDFFLLVRYLYIDNNTQVARYLTRVISIWTHEEKFHMGLRELWTETRNYMIMWRPRCRPRRQCFSSQFSPRDNVSYLNFSAHFFVVLTSLFQKSCCALRAILWIEAQKKLKRDLEVTALIGKIDNNNSLLYS